MNPRYAINVYLISNQAPSATRPPLRRLKLSRSLNLFGLERFALQPISPPLRRLRLSRSQNIFSLERIAHQPISPPLRLKSKQEFTFLSPTLSKAKKKGHPAFLQSGPNRILESLVFSEKVHRLVGNQIKGFPIQARQHVGARSLAGHFQQIAFHTNSQR